MPRLFQLVLALSLALCGTPLHAAPAREPAPMPFRVAAVEGKAMLVKPGRGEVKHLEPDVVMEEGHTFITLADGQVTVLLPNGTPLVIGPNSRLSVTAFRMNPPDAPVKGLGRLHKEPSQSQTHLILSHGTLCLSVKILNRGSAFLLETPVASLPLEEIALNVAVPLQKEPATDAYLAGLASVYAATPTPGDRGSAGAILPENLLVSPPKPQRGVFSLLKGALDMKWGEEKQIEVLPGDELVILTQGDLANNVQVSKEILAGSRRAKFEQMLSEGTGFFEVATPTKVERTDAASRAAATKAAVEAAMRRAHSSVSFTARTSPAPAERPKVAASAVEAAKPLPKPEELPPPSVSETLLTPPGAPEMPPTVVVADTAKPAPGKTGGDVWLRGEMLQPLPEPFRPYPETTPAEGVRPVEGASRPSKTYQPRWWR